MAAPLTQEHQIFLQAMMANRVMLYDNARRMHHEIITSASESGADRKSVSASQAFRLGDDPAPFDRFWSDIARALRFLDLDMRRVKWPEDDKLYLGVVNKQGGETAKLATRLSPEQIALFRVVLDEILRDDRSAERGVDVMAALNTTQSFGTQTQQGAGGNTNDALSLTQDQATSLAKMSKVDKEQTLRRLCVDGWLTQGDDEAGRLRLGVRAFLELRDFLLSNAPERAKAKWLDMI
jgi:hypothetical protein